MSQSESPARVGRYGVRAENRQDAIEKMVLSHPTLAPLYEPGERNDGKGGWVNAIRDQRESVYRLLFYLDRLPFAADYRGMEPHEVLYGDVHGDEPNYPRALFTMTGGVNLIPKDLPDPTFAAAVKTDSLEIVPLSYDRDMRTATLVKYGYGYICLYDGDADALRILDLQNYTEIFVIKDSQEVQVRHGETIIIGDGRYLKPFFLKYVVKQAEDKADDPAAAAMARLRGHNLGR